MGCLDLGLADESRTALPSLATEEDPNTKTKSKDLEGLHISPCFYVLGFSFVGLRSWLGSEVAVLGEIDIFVSRQQ